MGDGHQNVWAFVHTPQPLGRREGLKII
jgi:hypothetical protein